MNFINNHQQTHIVTPVTYKARFGSAERIETPSQFAESIWNILVVAYGTHPKVAFKKVRLA